MSEWAIQNYQPQWRKSANELLELLVQIPLIGLQVQTVWSLWDEDSDEWFSDAPIVICTREKQLEFCATKLNEFSFSLNSINLSVPVYWCGYEYTETKPLRWLQQKNPEFSDIPGEFVTKIEVVESCIEKEIQTFLNLETWILSGISLNFKDKYLEILNGLDCNILSRSRKTDRQLRYIQVEAQYN